MPFKIHVEILQVCDLCKIVDFILKHTTFTVLYNKNKKLFLLT